MTIERLPDHFEINEVSSLSDKELTSLLKQIWGYEKSQPFEVIGRLTEKKTAKSSFYVIEDIHSINDGSVLLYPLSGPDVRQNIFVGKLSGADLGDHSADGVWVTARIELSPSNQRELHKNPFGMRAIKEGVQILTSIPSDALGSEVSINGENHIEQWVIDIYRQNNRELIRKDGDALRRQLETQREDLTKQVQSVEAELKDLTSRRTEQIAQLRIDIDALNEEEANASLALEMVRAEVSRGRQQYQSEIRVFEQARQQMEHQLDTLKQFIEEKSKMLMELDLIGEKEVDELLGRSSSLPGITGHDFDTVFGADPVRVISYIQVYLHAKGIMYRRKVLEDFFALLKTQDLIILAGDSGSGKTNLVKSFAEAIGGKAVIVPVKPNWTSAEDLLGYYNPLEQKYLATPFLDALFEARRYPDVPYFICLDEMNLARVEYYFADFLSLMEERSEYPKIPLYSDTEASHLVSEVRNFISLIDEARSRLAKPDLISFLDLLSDDALNAKLQELCGFREGESLLKYHANLRRMMSSYVNVPSAIRLPKNVRIIGAINVDETTHYLSPKVLDRAHIIRFGSPLLMDWDSAESELESFDLDIDIPATMLAGSLGERKSYPSFDREDSLVQTLSHIAKEYLDPMGVEFGLRTVRQARHYSSTLREMAASDELILNNIVLHKILPKLMFDGEKTVGEGIARKDILIGLRGYLDSALSGLDADEAPSFCVEELDRVIRNAESNEWVVNYWSR